jgi:putative FmdB family regulatory protein
MPLYEYQCESCGVRFELIRKFSDPPLEACPTCGGPVRKLVSSPAFHLNGSGWYATDYARKSDSGDKAEKAEKAEKADKADKAEKGGAREPAAAAEGKTADAAAAKSGKPAAPATTSTGGKDN